MTPIKVYLGDGIYQGQIAYAEVATIYSIGEIVDINGTWSFVFYVTFPDSVR